MGDKPWAKATCIAVFQKFPVIVAELSGLTAKNHNAVVSDIVTVALSTDILRDDKLTLDCLMLGNRAQKNVSGDLLVLADQAGLMVPEGLLFEDSNVDSPRC